jgi:hypothetical protein
LALGRSGNLETKNPLRIVDIEPQGMMTANVNQNA